MVSFIFLHSSHGKDKVFKHNTGWTAVLHIVKKKNTVVMIHKRNGHSEPVQIDVDVFLAGEC